MSQSALKRIINLRDDDIFFSFDADEIPKKEVLIAFSNSKSKVSFNDVFINFKVILFLRLHDGFPSPILFNLRWSIFTFNWKHIFNGATMTKSIWHWTLEFFFIWSIHFSLIVVVAGTRVDFLKDIFDGNVIQLRKMFFYGGKKWDDYKGPKSATPFQVNISNWRHPNLFSDSEPSLNRLGWNPITLDTIALGVSLRREFPSNWGQLWDKIFQGQSIFCLLTIYKWLYICSYLPMYPFHARTAGPISTKFCTDLPANSGKVHNTSMTPPTQPLDPGLAQTGYRRENFVLRKMWVT